jgi:hypothetical protein
MREQRQELPVLRQERQELGVLRGEGEEVRVPRRRELRRPELFLESNTLERAKCKSNQNRKSMQ